MSVETGNGTPEGPQNNTPRTLETQQVPTYGLEALKLGITTSPLKELFDSNTFPKFQSVLRSTFLDSLGDAKNLITTEEQKQTIDLILWNAIITKGPEFASRVTEDPSQGGNLLEMFENIKQGNIKEDKLGESFNYLLTALTPEYGENFTILYNLIESQQNSLNPLKIQALLSNPDALEKILRDGKYEENGFSINLKEGKITLGVFDNLEEIKRKFLSNVTENTNVLGGKIEGLSFGKEIMEMLGLKGNTAPEVAGNIIKMLEEKGGIFGKILSMFLKIFFKSAGLEISETNSNYKKALENFGKYIGKEESTPPFQKGEITEEDKSNITSFVKKVEKEETKVNGNKEKGKDSIIAQDDFWKNLFSPKDPNKNPEDLLERLKTTISKIKGQGQDTQSIFLKNLAGVSIEGVRPAPVVNPDAATPDTPAPVVNPDAATPDTQGQGGEVEEGPKRYSRVSEIQSLPAIIEREGKPDLEVDIKDNKYLVINGQLYNVTVIMGGKDILKSIDFKNGNILIQTTRNHNKEVPGEDFLVNLDTILNTGSYEYPVKGEVFGVETVLATLKINQHIS